MKSLAVLGARGFEVLRKEGARAFLRKMGRRVVGRGLFKGRYHTAAFPYNVWIDQNEPTAADLKRQRQTQFPLQPKISIVVPTYNTPLIFFRSLMRSVLKQTYANWELCLADGASQNAELKRRMLVYQSSPEARERIRIHFLPANLGIIGNSNAGVGLASGDYITFLDHDDLLAPNALFEIVRAINQNPKAEFFYTDEDKIDEAGKVRSEPHFKPDWAPDNLRSHNYICHLSIYRRDLFTKLGGLRAGYEGSQDYDIILRATEIAQQIVHIPHVLYHWRIHAASTSSGDNVKTYAYESARKALRNHLVRRDVPGEVQNAVTHGIYQIRYRHSQKPRISIIIPNRDNPESLNRCLLSLKRSTYTNYEVLIVENNSERKETHDFYHHLSQEPNVSILSWPNAFNYSAVNNFAAARALGEVLLLLNNDVESINADWMERMLEHALRPEVGAVGAKLYYPDNTVQHAGVIVGLGGVAAHSHTHFPRGHYGYQGRLIFIQNLSAVTGACLMIRKELFEEVGGFDERLAIAFNDVDFCLRIRQKNYLIVWTPYAELYHCESKTRGVDDTPEKQARFNREIFLFKWKWGAFLKQGDPYYSPNLTYGAEDFSFKFV